MVVLTSNTPEETREIGKKIAKLLVAGDIISLEGPLGSGKTCLAQGIAVGLGVEDMVSSPSFVFIHEYRGKLPVYHVDAYRVVGVEEMYDTGCAEYFYGKGVTMLEWGDKVAAILPVEHLKVRLDFLDDERRVIRLVPFGRRYEELVEGLSGC